MPRYHVTTGIDVDDADPTRCGDACRHMDLAECRLFGGAPLIGTPEDDGAKLVRCPECHRATDGSPGAARCWPARGTDGSA